MAEPKRSIRSELLGVGNIFKADSRYRVPPYQRNFSWTADEVEQLWSDLTGAMEDGRPDYFLGTIVIGEEEDGKVRTIIDGQQRLATLTMIFSAIRTVYASRGDERTQEVYQEYLGLKDRRTRLTQSRLTLNEVNEPTFQRLVVENASDGDLDTAASDRRASESNRRLAEAALRIRNHVADKAKAAHSFDNYLIALEDFIKDRVIMIQVTVGDESDAYLVFETLNDRGLDLSTSDLLKNYIFGRAGAGNLVVVRKQWSEMTLILGTQSETQFLRHYWLSHFGVIRERDLYREFKQKFSSAPKILELMTNLRAAADNYAAMSSSDHPFYVGYPTSVRSDIDTLQLFGLSQFRPLLQAAMERWDQDSIAKVIRLIVVLSMRYSIIGSFGTGNIERAYADAAVGVREGKLKSPAQVFMALRAIYPDKDRFLKDFADAEISKPRLARYVLTSLANAMQGGEELGVLEDEKKVNLEHIMPKTRGGEWLKSAVDEDEYLRFVNRIGNLTLVERRINTAMGNTGFRKKRDEAYAKSALRLTSHITKYEQWTTREIVDRQQELAGAAIAVWSVPYE